MSFAFDLWSHDDVSQHADAILARLRARHHALRRRLAAAEDRGVPALDRGRQAGLALAQAWLIICGASWVSAQVSVGPFTANYALGANRAADSVHGMTACSRGPARPRSSPRPGCRATDPRFSCD